MAEMVNGIDVMWKQKGIWGTVNVLSIQPIRHKSSSIFPIIIILENPIFAHVQIL